MHPLEMIYCTVCHGRGKVGYAESSGHPQKWKMCRHCGGTGQEPITTRLSPSGEERKEGMWVRQNRALVQKLMSGEWVAVPREWTGEMREAFHNAYDSEDWQAEYRAMLAAAPKVPRAQTDRR